jgi:small subunit ribosomal protein S17
MAGATQTAGPKKASKKAAASASVETTSETRNQRKIRQGYVVANKMTKTVVVAIERRTRHALYGKTVIRSNRLKAHDELECSVGDLVEIMETRPLSKEKRWRVTRIIEKVK